MEICELRSIRCLNMCVKLNKCQKLRQICIADTPLTSSMLRNIFKCDGLEYVQISYCHYDDHVLRIEHKNVRCIVLNKCWGEGFDFSGCKKLKKIVVNFTWEKCRTFVIPYDLECIKIKVSGFWQFYFAKIFKKLCYLKVAIRMWDFSGFEECHRLRCVDVSECEKVCNLGALNKCKMLKLVVMGKCLCEGSVGILNERIRIRIRD